MTASTFEELSLPYQSDSLAWFEQLRELPWPALLASGPLSGGRFDFVCADPAMTLTTRNGRTVIEGWHTTTASGDDPFMLARDHLLRLQPRQVPAAEGFVGGLLGYFAYDLARNIEQLPTLAARDIGLPEMALGIYPWVIVSDHSRARTTLRFSPLCSHSDRSALRKLMTGPKRREESAPFELRSTPSANLSPAAYRDGVARILEYIGAGDCYQVNLTQRLSARYEGDPISLYRQLSRALPARHAAYLEFPGSRIISCSPEQFLGVREGEVVTKPIKGTRPRGGDRRSDQRLADELLRSEKDRAENLMIVDLLRNDLGRCCLPGSIRVPELFQLYSLPNVHHLVSRVTGAMAPGRHALDLLRGCFPGGSITGAPKIRAMEIIEELEPARRSIYTGSIAYAGFDGNMDSNIAIRTLLCSDGRIHCWGGGGIVADSDWQLEYQESLDKIGLLLAEMGRTDAGMHPAAVKEG